MLRKLTLLLYSRGRVRSELHRLLIVNQDCFVDRRVFRHGRNPHTAIHAYYAGPGAIVLATAPDALHFPRNRRPLAQTFAEIAAEVLPAFQSSALEYTV